MDTMQLLYSSKDGVTATFTDSNGFTAVVRIAAEDIRRLNAAVEVKQPSRNGYDYKNQAWVVDGRYERCAHSDDGCGCYGRQHAGEPVPTSIELH